MLDAREVVAKHVPRTPAYRWPLLGQHLDAEVWVKHENVTPVGSFKIRGGLTYLNDRNPAQVITATRGNHGQSVAFAASAIGSKATVVVPHGNNPEKNASMRALGAELIEFGRDFDEAHDHARSLAADRGMHLVPSFHEDLVAGVSTYALELFQDVTEPDVVYVPIGQGSGICGVIAAREALGLKTEVVGVVARRADAYAQSFSRRELVETDSADTFADGIAVRIPVKPALDILFAHAARIVAVTEREIADAVRLFFTAAHNVVEGAGAATLAAATKEKESIRRKRVALIASGGNIDTQAFRTILDDRVPGRNEPLGQQPDTS